jgi:menaquinone-dependent protoporphyrinogen oxidase
MSNCICIIYDTKRGSTRQIVEWMGEAVKDREVKIMQVNEVKNLDKCNLVVIGSPIYYERPLKSVLRFLELNEEELRNKKIAVFIVCIAEIFGNIGREYAQKRYVGALLKRISGDVIKTGIIKGWFKNPDFSQKENAQKWIREVIKLADSKFLNKFPKISGEEEP